MSHRKDYRSSTRWIAQPIIRHQQQNLLRQWIPLGVTILAVTIGISAWIWSEQKDTDVENDEDNDDTASDEDDQSNTPEHSESSTSARQHWHAGDTGHRNDVEPSHSHRSFESDDDNPSDSVATSSAIPHHAARSSEEDEDQAEIAYHDHHTWQAEAESLARAKALDTEDSEDVHPVSPVRTPGNALGRTASRRKLVAIVLSASGNMSHEAGDFDDANNSLLSHLPTDVDFSKARVFILVLAPWLREHPSNSSADGEESAASFEAVQLQAEAVVEKASMVFPFTAPSSYIQMLRQLKPDYVYLQNSLADDNAVTQLQTWLRQDIVIVVGLRTDDETERVGVGKGITIVDAKRLHEDFHRRIYQELV